MGHKVIITVAKDATAAIQQGSENNQQQRNYAPVAVILQHACTVQGGPKKPDHF